MISHLAFSLFQLFPKIFTFILFLKIFTNIMSSYLKIKMFNLKKYLLRTTQPKNYAQFIG